MGRRGTVKIEAGREHTDALYNEAAQAFDFPGEFGYTIYIVSLIRRKYGRNRFTEESKRIPP
jgi:hypothetical protein